MYYPSLERTNLVADGVGRSQYLEDPRVESSLIRARRHLYDDHGPLGNALARIVVTRMLSFHLLENHRFSHTAVAVEQHARHAGACWIVKSSFEFLDGDSCARVGNPAGRLHRYNPCFCIITGQFARRRREM